MVKGLLDTDIFSEFLKGRNAAVQGHTSRYLQRHGRLTLSVVTVMEVVKGLHKVGREADITRLVALVAAEEALPLDVEAAEKAGRIHAELERGGQPIGWADTVIAAIAVRHGLELVTGNTSHYERVQRLGYPLALSNWKS